MSKIEGYGVYQNSYMGGTTQSKSAREAEKTEKPEKKEPDYESEEEAAAYLSRGTKEFSTLIDPETLEAMAADKDVKDKYMGILDDAVGKLKDIKEQLGDSEDDVARVGISIDKDGKVSYFAELEKSGERQKEWVEKTREAKKEERAEQEKKAQEQKEQDIAAQGRTKKTIVKADTVEELLEKIKNVDWNQIKSEEKQVTGGKFDFSI